MSFLSRVSVPRTDAGLVHVGGDRLLELQLPGYFPSASTLPDARRHLQGHERPIYLHELYPIVPALQILPLDKALWNENTTAEDTWLRVWQDAWAKQYRPLFRTADDAVAELRNVVEPVDSLGLFGVELKGIIQVCKALKNTSMLMHYMMITTLQYYLAARNRWMCIRTDLPNFVCDDLYPTFTFLMFRGADWGVKESKDLELSVSNLLHTAQTQSFPLLLKAVMLHQLDLDNSLYDEDEVDKFCLEKLKKNFAQAMVCTRFRELLPTNLLTTVNSQLPPHQHLKLKAVKFYPHPNHIKMLSLRSKEFDVVERVPQMYCHLHFTPVSKVVSMIPNEPFKWTVWKLLMYLPLTDFEKQVQSKFPKPFYPQTLEDKAAHYDPLFPALSYARLRYCIYICNETAYAYLPWCFQSQPPSEDQVSPAMQAWSRCTGNPPPQGPILFDGERAVLKPGNPLLILEQSTSALKQQMMKDELVQEVKQWLAMEPSTVTQKHKTSLETLLHMCTNAGLAAAVHDRLALCTVVKVE